MRLGILCPDAAESEKAMTKYECTFHDGNTKIVEADEYKAEGTVCVFYEGQVVRRIVPLYMLEKIEKVRDE